MIMGEFVILRNGKIEKYSSFDDIPESFEHVIKFLPDFIPGPHTDSDHQEMSKLNDKLKELMKRETR
jgi:hypothetical protein